MVNKVPSDAKRLPPELIASGQISKSHGHLYAWTEVKAKTVTQQVQQEDGMGKGQTVYRVEVDCPRCGEPHYFHSTEAHAPAHRIADPSGTKNPDGTPVMVDSGFSGHPVRCHCDATLIFRALW